MVSPFTPADPVSTSFRTAVGAVVTDFLDRQRPVLAAIGPELDEVSRLAGMFTAGGKRLRPAFCYWGYVAAAGQPSNSGPLLQAAASLDLLHVSALVHDDVMDASDTRRGLPAAHRQWEALHRASGWRGDADAFGRAGAILLGDLLLLWSVQMLSQAGLDAHDLTAALPVIDAMRTEVTCGQVLDVVVQAQRPLSGDGADRGIADALDEASRVVEFKSARYTVQRPAQFGARLGGADDRLMAALAAYGSPLGRAFQFRDDVLGVFGDAEVTGKPAGDDLREGKRTVLVAHALAGSWRADAARLDGLLGRRDLSPDEVATARDIIATSGALAKVEQMIDDGYERALAALDAASMTAEGREALTVLAQAAVRRTS